MFLRLLATLSKRKWAAASLSEGILATLFINTHDQYMPLERMFNQAESNALKCNAGRRTWVIVPVDGATGISRGEKSKPGTIGNN